MGDTVDKKVLAIGSPGNADPSIMTVDVNPAIKPDVVHDLNVVPWPFEDNQFKKIICYHVIEHLVDIEPCMHELHRICDPTGEIYIEVPHHTSFYAKSLHHKLQFHYFSIDEYIDNGVEKDWHTSCARFKLLDRKITFHRSFRKYFFHKLFNLRPLMYERFWAYVCPAEHIKFWLQPIK